MDDIVQDAVENKEQEDRKSNVDTATDDNGFGEPRIVVVGCGGAGNNTINRLYNIGVDGADTVALNTDKQHLKADPSRHQDPRREGADEGAWRGR